MESKLSFKKLLKLNEDLTALDFYCTQLTIQWKVFEIHWTRSCDCNPLPKKKVEFQWTVSTKFRFGSRPHAASDLSIPANANEFVGRRHDVEVGRFLISKEGVRYPHVAQVFGTHWQDFDAVLTLKWESIIFPVLPKVDIQREILKEIE